MNDFKTISIKYNATKEQIEAEIGTEKITVPYIGRLDKIRQSNLENAVANISVHECGHAVVYMLLMNMAPLQLKSKIANSYAGGFTFPHDIHETKENLINKIKIYLAGGLAEELVFGEQKASVGRSHDREQATVLSADYIRRYGFDDEFHAVYSLDNYPYRMEMKVTDTDIEKMIARLVAETKELIMLNLDLLKDLSRILANKGSLDAAEVVVIAKKHGLNPMIKEEGYLHIYDYKSKLD
jgi:ATP-dependent Zn protease